MIATGTKESGQVDKAVGPACFVLCPLLSPGNTKGGSITVPLTSRMTGLESAV